MPPNGGLQGTSCTIERGKVSMGFEGVGLNRTGRKGGIAIYILSIYIERDGWYPVSSEVDTLMEEDMGRDGRRRSTQYWAHAEQQVNGTHTRNTGERCGGNFR